MKTKFKQAHAMYDDPETALNLTEIASDLVQESNFYTLATEELPDLTTAEYALQLAKMLSTDTIKFFLEGGDYGRGFLSGLAVGIATLEMEVDRQLAHREEMAGGEDMVTDDEIEETIYRGLTQGLRGGKKEGSDGENH